ncbi:hypothetical protein BH10PLA1_BH10PLA1_13220 [soil metagenome]
MKRMIARPILCVALLTLIAGCVTTTTSPPPLVTKQPAVPGSYSPEQAIASDPCAARLHEISGAILSYYAIERHLPATLADAKSVYDGLGDSPQPLDLNCPVQHQPYVYVPQGLATPGNDKRIILHDPAPNADGQRWCAFMALGAGGGASQSVEVLLVPEAIFRGYVAP